MAEPFALKTWRCLSGTATGRWPTDNRFRGPAQNAWGIAPGGGQSWPPMAVFSALLCSKNYAR